MFSGCITALATPFKDGKVHTKGLQDLVEFQISQGVDGLVPCGSTGEAATMSLEEQALVIRTVAERAQKRVPVIAGAGTNATEKAIQLSQMAAEAGADALLHVTPYYNKPTPAGQLAHFQAVAEATQLPVILYNVPGRTGCDMQPQTIAQLAQVKNIVAVKEATGLVSRGQQVIAACPKDFGVLSGEDATCLALTLMGGAGVISVVSNIAPALTAQMIAAGRQGRVQQARELHYRLLPLMDLLFVESNPIPVKAALSLMGYTANEVRRPLLPLGAEKLELLRAEMNRLGLL